MPQFSFFSSFLLSTMFQPVFCTNFLRRDRDPRSDFASTKNGERKMRGEVGGMCVQKAWMSAVVYSEKKKREREKRNVEKAGKSWQFCAL